MPTCWETLVREAISYDPETGLFTWVKRGRGRSLTKEPGTINGDGHRVILINGKLFKGHNLAWFLYYGVWPDKEVDHIDRKPAHNSIDNLRLATRNEQQRNRKSHRNSYTSFRGVVWEKDRKKWKASIRLDGRLKNLGRFDSVFEAADCYDKAAWKNWGEFAYLNSPWRLNYAN